MKTKEKKSFKVFARCPPVADCGVFYYRQYLPLTEASKKKKAEILINDFTFGEDTNEKKDMTDKEMQQAGEWADIFYFSRNDIPDYIAKAGAMKEFFNKPIVMDLDDNVQATRPYNPGYRSFHPNSPNMVWNIKSMGVFDALIVSTDEIKRFYSEYMNPDNIYVCPNSLDWKERDEAYNADYSKSELFKKKPGEIRIGWHGSSAHWENLKHIEEPLMQILRDYPQTTFYYTGLFGDIFDKSEFKDRIVQVPWSNLKNWAKANREMNFDIALAPLADNLFNRAKSNLRLLEYASAKYPVIASPVEPYLTFTNKEIILAKEQEEWYNGMEELILSEKRRKELSNNLYKEAKKRYDIDKNYALWISALKDIKRKFNNKTI